MVATATSLAFAFLLAVVSSVSISCWSFEILSLISFCCFWSLASSAFLSLSFPASSFLALPQADRIRTRARDASNFIFMSSNFLVGSFLLKFSQRLQIADLRYDCIVQG